MASRGGRFEGDGAAGVEWRHGSTLPQAPRLQMRLHARLRADRGGVCGELVADINLSMDVEPTRQRHRACGRIHLVLHHVEVAFPKSRDRLVSGSTSSPAMAPIRHDSAPLNHLFWSRLPLHCGVAPLAPLPHPAYPHAAALATRSAQTPPRVLPSLRLRPDRQHQRRLSGVRPGGPSLSLQTR